MRASPPRRLVVRVEADGAGSTVAAFVGRVLAASGATEDGAAAVARGAVFIDRKRATDAERLLELGQTVQVTAAGEDLDLDVLHEDDHVIVLAKPTGISSVADLSDHAGSLLGRAEQRWGTGLHLLGRLDREVTGVVVVLRTARARARAVEARRQGKVERVYLALVAPSPSWKERVVDVAIGRDPRDARRRKVDGPDAEPATTRLAVQHELRSGAALVEARPVSGRMHQIRVHLAHEGSPVLGDRAYGGARRLVLESGEIVGADRVLLHAQRLTMPHPGGRGSLTIEAPLPDDFRELLSTLSSRA